MNKLKKWAQGEDNTSEWLKTAINSMWIPCSEILPEEDGRYFVTIYDYVTKSSFVDILWYEKHTWWNRRIVGDFAVKAWMPLQKPWKGADDED